MKIAHLFISSMMENHKMAISSSKQYEKSLESARSFIPDGGKWVRRFIVVVAMISVIVVPTFAPIFTNVPVNYLYSEEAGWFIWSYDKLKILTVTGITILPLYTQTVSALIGFYYGSRIGK